MKLLLMILIVSSLSSSGEQGWRKGQAVSDSLLHSLPLQQKWMQTLLGNSRGKISLFLILGLCNQNMPMSNWARFTVSLATAPYCFFLCGLGMVLLHLWVLWCYAYLQQKCSQWVCVSGWDQFSLRARVVAGISLVPRVQSVGFDGRCHNHERCPKRLVQDDFILKCSQHGDGADQRLNVELWNRTILWCDIHVTKVSGKVGNVVEDFLKKGVALPVYLMHICLSCIIPTSPLSVVDESDEFHKELVEDGRWAVGGGDCCDNWIHVDTEAWEVEDGSNSANMGNGTLCLRLVHVKNIHALFGIGNHV